jgi:hypothetical protein
MRPPISESALRELRRRRALGPQDDRGTQDRGTADRGTDRGRRGLEPSDLMLAGSSRDAAPTGFRFALREGLTVSPRGLRLEYLALKPEFTGEAEIRFGSTNPELELIRRRSSTELEIRRQVEEGLVQTLTVRVHDAQLAVLGRCAEAIASGGEGPGGALQAVLATELAQHYEIANLEIEPVPAEVSVSAWRGTVSVYFLRLTGEWERLVYRTEILGVPAEVVLVGKITLKAGITGGGWSRIASMLATRLGPAMGASQLERLSAQLAVRGVVNGLVGLSSPVVVPAATFAITALIVIAWANYMEGVHAYAELGGYLNQFAFGYVRRVAYPRAGPHAWRGQTVTPSQAYWRDAGISAAEADLRRYAPEVLFLNLYVALDYAGNARATVEDIATRLGFELWEGRRTVEAPARRR